MSVVDVLEKSFVIEIFGTVLRNILRSSLGESAGEAVLFFLRRGLGRDPFEAFWDNPKSVYQEMVNIFGVGAKILINILVMRINSEFGLNMSSERFVELMQRGDESSVEEIRSSLTKIAELYERKEIK